MLGAARYPGMILFNAELIARGIPPPNSRTAKNADDSATIQRPKWLPIIITRYRIRRMYLIIIANLNFYRD